MKMKEMNKMNTKKNRRFCLFPIMLLLLGLLFTGCGFSNKQTVKSEDMQIELPRDFQKSTMADTSWYYKSMNGPEALGIRTKKSDLEKMGFESDSVNDYVTNYIKANEIQGNPVVESKNNYLTFTYSKKVNGTKYSYVYYIFENGDEYWLVSFSCYADVLKEYHKTFDAAAKSVEFVEE